MKEATASERLSLQEEYENQRSWTEDPKKLTLIILHKELFLATNDECEAMIGDTNIFLHDFDEGEVAEIEVMIAIEKFRCKGLAHEAVCCLMSFAIDSLFVTKFIAKISESNIKSLNLFRNRLKFKDESYSSAFKEYTLSHTPSFKKE